MAPVATEKQHEQLINPFYSPSTADDGNEQYKYAQYKVCAILGIAPLTIVQPANSSFSLPSQPFPGSPWKRLKWLIGAWAQILERRAYFRRPPKSSLSRPRLAQSSMGSICAYCMIHKRTSCASDLHSQIILSLLGLRLPTRSLLVAERGVVCK